MKATSALADLLHMGKPVVTTGEIARLRMSDPTATRALQRLPDAGLVVQLRRGLWLLQADADPLAIVDAVLAPWPGYVSMRTALAPTT